MQPRMQYEVENLNKLPLNQADLEEMNSKESTYRRISALGKLVVECQAQVSFKKASVLVTSQPEPEPEPGNPDGFRKFLGIELLMSICT